MNQKRILLSVLVSAALSLSSSVALSQGKTATVKIGVNESVSGNFVSIGLPAHTAIRLAVQEINLKGFRVGDTTYKMELVEVDNRSEGAAVIAGMTKLIEDDKVKVVFGPTVSALANQAQEISVPAKVLHFSAAGSWETLGYVSDPKKPLLFRTQMPLGAISRIDIEGVKQLGAKKIAYMGADDDTTKGNMGPFLEEAKRAGITVIPILFPPKTADFSSFVTRAKGENVDATYFIYPQSSVPDLLRAMTELNAGAKGFGGRSINPSAALTLAIGKPIPFPFFTTGSTPSFEYPPNAKVKAFTERMKKTGVDLGIYASASFFSYDFVHMLAAAMTKAGSVDDTTKIAATMGAMTFDGVGGKVCFTKELRSSIMDGGLTFVRNGKVESKTVPSTCK